MYCSQYDGQGRVIEVGEFNTVESFDVVDSLNFEISPQQGRNTKAFSFGNVSSLTTGREPKTEPLAVITSSQQLDIKPGCFQRSSPGRDCKYFATS